MTVIIHSSESLWRRVHRDHFKKGRVTSAAFKDYEMSVDRANIQESMQATLLDGVGVAKLNCGDVNSLGQQVRAAPRPDNAAHALVIGTKTTSISRQIRKMAVFVSKEDILSV